MHMKHIMKLIIASHVDEAMHFTTHPPPPFRKSLIVTVSRKACRCCNEEMCKA